MPDRIPGKPPRLRLLGRALVVAGLVLASSLSGGVALAGGPTSVLLVSEAGRASALHASDGRYQKLSGLLAATSPTPAAGAPSGPPDTAPAVTATWLAHNVSVWRIEYLYLDRPEGPWVWRQEVGHDGVNPDAAQGTWFRPEDPAGLLALLGEMQVLEGQAGVQPAGVQPAGVQPAGVQQVAADPAPGIGGGSGLARGFAGGPWWDGWWWAAAGSLVGGAGTVLGLRSLPAARRRVLAAPVDEPVDEPVATAGERT